MTNLGFTKIESIIIEFVLIKFRNWMFDNFKNIFFFSNQRNSYELKITLKKGRIKLEHRKNVIEKTLRDASTSSNTKIN